MKFFKFIRCLVNCLTEPAGQGCCYCETEEKASEKALLTEYKVCQSHNNSLASVHWTTANIFVGLATALLGGVSLSLLKREILSGKEDQLLAFVLVLTLGFGAILLIILMRLWLKRTNCLIANNRDRMREIECQLKMKKIHMQDKLKSSTMTGREIIQWVYNLIIILWLIVIFIVLLMLLT